MYNRFFASLRMTVTSLRMTVLVLLLAGQVAQATTKTVTYTFNYGQLVDHSSYQYVGLTHSGDTPFDGNTTVNPQKFSDHTYANLQLPDGFTFYVEWGSATKFNSSGIGVSHDEVNLKYKVTWNFNRDLGGANYYVTKVQLTDINGYPMKLEGGGTASTDYNYSEYEGSKMYTAAKGPANSNSTGAFYKLILTYSDTPGLSIFESAGTNAYKIKDFFDLRRLADYVNKGKNDCNGLTFIQISNINNLYTYTPIGHNNYNDVAPFSGTYDGQGGTISNVTVNTPDGNNVGLFGYVKGGTVQGIILEKSSFTGLDAVGGIVGENHYGTVRDCYVKSNVTISAGASNARFHGGIVGLNEYDGEHSYYSKVFGCVSAAKVKHNNKSGCNNYGGIVGHNKYGTIRDCLYIGSATETTITASKNIGCIAGLSDKGKGTYYYNNYYINSDIGAVTINGDEASSDLNGARKGYTVTLSGDNGFLPEVAVATTYNASGLTAIGTNNCALRHNTTIYSCKDQSITFSYSGTVPDGCLYAFSTTGTTAGILGNAKLTMADADVEVFGIFTWTGSGSSSSPYLITHTCQMKQLAIDVKSGVDHHGEFFALNNDLTYDHTSAWNATDSHENNYTPIGEFDGKSYPYFKGTFDGKGKTISGIRVYKSGTGYASGYAGLFGYLGNGGTVQNLTLTDARITALNNAGGIAGNSGGSIINCHVTSTVCIHAEADCSSHGGIAGYITHSVTGSTSSAKLTIANGVTGCSRFGGIVGYNGSQGSVTECLAVNVALPGNVSKVGAISGDSHVSYNYYRNLFRNCTIGGAVTTVGFTYSNKDYSPSQGAEPGYFVNCSAGSGITAIPTHNPYANLDSQKKKYDYNGLTVYKSGNIIISYDDVYYCSTGSSLDLQGASYFKATKTSDGTDVSADVLSGTTLNMPAFDVTIGINSGSIKGYLNDGSYWASYYNGTSRKILPEGAVAYTMDKNYNLYRLGTDGRVIPAGVAVIIISKVDNFELTSSDDTTPVADHAPGGNILLGSDTAVALVGDDYLVPVPGSSPATLGVPYVLGHYELFSNHYFGFMRFTGVYSGKSIPANRAYYVKVE